MRILYLNILADELETIKRFEKEVFQGSYSELFHKKMGIGKEELVSINAALEELPDPAQFDGMVIGGSIRNPVPGEEKPWMEKVYICIRKAAKERIPVLGVCGGHQFVSRALGQEVIYNPDGLEFGTTKIKLTEQGRQDPLFRGIPERFEVQQSHRCIVKHIEPEWQLLASSDLSIIQAVAINERTRTIQFHPELDACHMKTMASMNKSNLLREGFVKDEEDFHSFLTSIQDTPEAAKVLRNFVDNFVLPSQKR